MFRRPQIYILNLCCRSVTSATVAKPSVCSSPLLSSTEEGIQLVSLPRPSLWSGLTRIALVFNAGSRHEVASNRGITHLIRRAFGISTDGFTSINLTRHFQQMGARVQCTTTREHSIYTVDVAPNLAKRAGYLLAHMATKPAYYEWELKDTVYKLMHTDVNILTRRNLNGLSLELLHEAAYGISPLGSGLGNSLFSAADRIGSHSLEQIIQFHQQFYTPMSCLLGVIGEENPQTGIELLNYIKTGLQIYPPQSCAEKPDKTHGFIGGEIRRELNAASVGNAYLAWPVPEVPTKSVLFDLITCLLNGARNRVTYGGTNTQCPMNLSDTEDDNTVALAFYQHYSDHGLFTIGVTGNCSKSINRRLSRIISTLRSLNLSAEELQSAKMMCKADYAMLSENPMYPLTDVACLHTYDSFKERCTALDNLGITDVTNALKKTVNSNHVAFTAVGPDIGEILPISVILSS